LATAAVPDQEETRRRVRRAAYACISRFGIAKTTVDDVAKESGVSRATIYRLFPGGRDQVLRETVGREMNRFFGQLAAAVDLAPDLATRLEVGLAHAHRAVHEHVVLQKVLDTEPELLLPLLTLEQHRILGYMSAYFRPLLQQEADHGRLGAEVDLDLAADFLARMVLSLIGSPGDADLGDPAQVRSLVRNELLGGIVDVRI